MPPDLMMEVHSAGCWSELLSDFNSWLNNLGKVQGNAKAITDLQCHFVKRWQSLNDKTSKYLPSL